MIIIFGPEAVGKMTVGRYLETKLGYTTFHNHLVIEFVRNFFEPTEQNFWPLISKVRKEVFDEVASSYIPGFVITTLWNFDEPSDHEYIERIVDIFEEKLWEVKFVELEAGIGTRMRRHKREDRIQEKPMLGDTEQAEALFMEMEDLKLNTDGDFSFSDNYLKINSTNLNIEETANIIIDHFSLDNLPENEFEAGRK